LCGTVLRCHTVPTQHISFRIDADTLSRLDALGSMTGQSRADLLNTLVDEGLRMESHPGIVFRPGPAGRRPGLIAGPDVWEVARLLKDVEGTGDAAVAQTAELIDLRIDQVEAALSYYLEHRAEVDAWIARLDDYAAREEAAFERRRQALA